MEITTIQALDEWMTSHCYNDRYGIGNRVIHEGYGLGIFDSVYVWYYTERGKREHLRFFPIERVAVEYAFHIIRSDPSASRHLVGFLKEPAQQQALLAELESRHIEWWKDEIPYGGITDPRTRIFVFGCDIHQVLDLQQKYTQWK